MLSEDEAFARHYFLSLMKEIRMINKSAKAYYELHKI